MRGLQVEDDVQSGLEPGHKTKGSGLATFTPWGYSVVDGGYRDVWGAIGPSWAAICSGGARRTKRCREERRFAGHAGEGVAGRFGWLVADAAAAPGAANDGQTEQAATGKGAT